ncbi:hypothetical protein NL676_032936 [Syzygium grande]|nr:hypothetical protein NL676_032936 [Syzygium grande]
MLANASYDFLVSTHLPTPRLYAVIPTRPLRQDSGGDLPISSSSLCLVFSIFGNFSHQTSALFYQNPTPALSPTSRFHHPHHPKRQHHHRRANPLISETLLLESCCASLSSTMTSSLGHRISKQLGFTPPQHGQPAPRTSVEVANGDGSGQSEWTRVVVGDGGWAAATVSRSGPRWVGLERCVRT